MRMPATLLCLWLLGGCTSSPLPFADSRPPTPLPAKASFVLDADGPASVAVRQALVEAGFQEKSDGDWRIQVGFAVRPANLSVAMPGNVEATTIISPRSRRTLGLCKRQAYVLTVAFVDRETGKITSRRGATKGRCSGDAAEILPELARAALAIKDERTPRRQT